MDEIAELLIRLEYVLVSVLDMAWIMAGQTYKKFPKCQEINPEPWSSRMYL